MSLDTTAMHIGYSVMAGTALGVGGSIFAATFPRETSKIIAGAAMGAIKLQVKAKKFYKNHVTPVIDDIKEMFYGISTTPYMENRILVIKDGKIIAATTSPDMLGLLNVDLKDYDMVLYNFGEGETVPVIRFDKLSDVNDDFKISDHRFINVTLHIGDDQYTLNLNEPENYYMVGNRILDYDFVKWWSIDRLGLAELPDDYKISVIDGNADQLSLGINDAIRIQLDGYDVLEKVNSDTESDNTVEVDAKETKEEVTEDSPKKNKSWWSFSNK